MSVIEHRKFVCTDALNNNNKFWEYLLHDNSTVVVKYGRVGKTCTEDPPKAMSRAALDRKIQEKLRGRGAPGDANYKPPYHEIEVVAESMEAQAVGQAVVRESAHQQLVASAPKKHATELSRLVDQLVAANRHELLQASGGKMDIDLKTGIVSTPIGVITKSTVHNARQALDSLAPFVQSRAFDDGRFIEGLNQYLMLVPQTVGSSRGWHRDFLRASDALQRQSTLLDQLEASADLAASRALMAAKNQGAATDLPALFNAELSLVTDKRTIKMIEDKFFKTINQNHETRNMRPHRFFEVVLPDARDAFQANLVHWRAQGKDENVWMLWHGTRMFNVLSILKSGLFCPPRTGSFSYNGRMYGNGIYGSDQSTKALNYSHGFWDGGARDRTCFMFLVDFAMGTIHTPRNSQGSFPVRGSDSTFAKAGVSGVRNNEMIVYRNEQANIRYLIEFGEKR